LSQGRRTHVLGHAAALLLALGACRSPAEAPLPCREGLFPLPARAYDVALLADGDPAVALSTGVVRLDACGLAVVARCDDPAEARRLLPRAEGVAVDYLRRDGTVAGCDLARGAAVPAHADAAARLAAPRSATAGGRTLRVESGRARLQGDPPLPLRGPREVLDVALSPAGDLAALAGRAGEVWLLRLPGGLPVATPVVHSRNVYGVALDGARGRVISVAGPGELAVRALPTR